MFPFASEPITAPVGGAELGQVIGLSIAATVVTGILLVVAWAHRTHRIEWFQKLGDRLGSRTGEPGWATIPVLFVGSSLIVALLGFMWDVSLHAGRGRDAGPLANPAHYLILYGLFALFVAGISAIVFPRDGEKPGMASVRITRNWYAPVSGIFIAACGRLRTDRFPARRRMAPTLRTGRDLVGPDPPDAHRWCRSLDSRHHPAPPRGGVPLNDRGLSMPAWLRTATLSVAIGGLLLGLSVFQGEFDFDVPQFRLVLEPLMIVARRRHRAGRRPAVRRQRAGARRRRVLPR